MKRSALQLAVILLLMGFAAWAQDTPSLPPGFVFRNQTPDFSSWTIRIVHPETEKDRQSRQEAFTAAMQKMAADHPGVARIVSVNPTLGTMKPPVEKIQVTKTGKVRREEISFVGGKTEQRWWIPAGYVQKDPFTGRVNFEGGVDGEGMPAFPELAWITAGNFRGVDKTGALIFEGRQDRLALEDPKLFGLTQGVGGEDAQVAVKALIDPKSQLPLSVEWEGQIRTYQFGPAPSTPLTLPPDLAAIVQQSAKRAAAATRPLSPP
jgi:ribosomal protein L19